MNISEQLNLLQTIKENIKTKLIETGAKINDLTPFKEYSKYILMPIRSAIIDKVIVHNQPLNIKEIMPSTYIDSVDAEKYSV